MAKYDQRGLAPDVLARLRARQKVFGDYHALSIASGVPIGTIQKIMRGATDPKIGTLLPLAKALGVSLDHLLTGEGESDLQKEVIDRFRESMSNTVLEAHFPKVSPQPLSVPILDAEDMQHVPIRDVVVSAGPGGEVVGGRPLGYLAFPSEMLRRLGPVDRLELVPIRGDSMEPELRDGDLAMVDTSRTDRAEGLLVLSVDDRLVAKRLRFASGGQVELLSANVAYPPVRVNLESEALLIHGRIVSAVKTF